MMIRFVCCCKKYASSLTPNGTLLVLMELAFDKAQHKAGFAHC